MDAPTNSNENRSLVQLLERIKNIHDRKQHDYVTGHTYENFTRSASIAEWFNEPVDKAFVILIGTKLARLATLLNGRAPKNEPIYDSFLDLCTYCCLWTCFNEERVKSTIQFDMNEYMKERLGPEEYERRRKLGIMENWNTIE